MDFGELVVKFVYIVFGWQTESALFRIKLQFIVAPLTKLTFRSDHLSQPYLSKYKQNTHISATTKMNGQVCEGEMKSGKSSAHAGTQRRRKKNATARQSFVAK